MKSKKDQLHVGRPLANVRRRVLPLASTAAAMGLAGCGLLGGGHAKVQSDEAASNVQDSATVAPQRTAAQVRALTDGLDAAIDKMDESKRKAIAQRVMTGSTSGERANAGTQGSTIVPASVTTSESAALDLSNLQLPLNGVGPVRSMTSVVGAGVFGMAAPADAFQIAVDSAGDEFASPFDVGSLTAPRVVAEAAVTPPSVEAAMDVLRARIAARPSLNTALALALLEKSEGRTVDGAAAKDLSATDQKLLTDLLGALDGINAQPRGNLTLSDRAVPLVEAAKKWQADADLVLPKLALASRVDSFGVYTKVEPKFTAGKKQAVIIYCEVANFQAKKTEEGVYETRLSQQETLVTDDGLLMWRPNVEEVEDRSKNQRHDFYLVKKLTIPDTIPAGKYALRMSVTDKNSGKIAVVTLPIEMVK